MYDSADDDSESVASALLGSGCGAALPNINVYRKFQMAIKGANTIDTTPPCVR
jgi:hypothetical protein